MKRKLLKLAARILLKISEICFRLTGPAMWLHDRLDDLHVWFDKKGDRILVRLEGGPLAGLASPFRYGLEPEQGITVIRDGKPYPVTPPPPIDRHPPAIDGQISGQIAFERAEAEKAVHRRTVDVAYARANLLTEGDWVRALQLGIVTNDEWLHRKLAVEPGPTAEDYRAAEYLGITVEQAVSARSGLGHCYRINLPPRS